MDLSHKKPGTLTHYEALVANALQHVVEALDEALDLQALAAPACMAPLHFHRVFRGLVGETPLQLHRRLRLERAAWRLAHCPGESVLRIALGAGYDTHESFTRAFREAFCRAPTEHRALAAAAGGMARPPPNRLQAACGLHADGPFVTWPVDAGLPFIHTGALTMKVDIETCPARRVAALSHQGPYNTIGAAFARLGAIVGPAGLCAHPDARMVAIYQDDPETVPAAQLRSAAGLIVPAGLGIRAPLHEVLLPAGRWACTLHRGSYQELGDAWERFLGQWLPQSGHRLAAGDCFELYLNEMADTREEDQQTLLYVPLQD